MAGGPLAFSAGTEESKLRQQTKNRYYRPTPPPKFKLEWPQFLRPIFERSTFERPEFERPNFDLGDVNSVRGQDAQNSTPGQIPVYDQISQLQPDMIYPKAAKETNAAKKMADYSQKPPTQVEVFSQLQVVLKKNEENKRELDEEIKALQKG